MSELKIPDSAEKCIPSQVIFLKTWPDFLALMESGKKRFDHRPRELKIVPGDIVVFQSYDPDEGCWLPDYIVTIVGLPIYGKDAPDVFGIGDRTIFDFTILHDWGKYLHHDIIVKIINGLMANVDGGVTDEPFFAEDEDNG